MPTVLACLVASCASQPSGESYVRQKTPVEIRSGKAVTIALHLSQSGVNDVGLRCPPDVWQTLTNKTGSITVRLVSSDQPGTVVQATHPNGDGTSWFTRIPNTHYMFCVRGGNSANTAVEIIFSYTPDMVSPAEIIVGKTQSDTGR